MTYATTYNSPLGSILLASDGGQALTGLWLEGQRFFPDSFIKETIPGDNQSIMIRAKLWLDSYFAGEKPSADELPTAPAGNEFRQTVWKILRRIPYGETVTYGEIAREIASLRGIEKMSAQAIGGAVGHNPISVIIPCHRVIGSGGSLTGYAGGINLKIRLLTHEGVDMSGLYIPREKY